MEASRKKARSFFIFAKTNIVCRCILEGDTFREVRFALCPSYNATTRGIPRGCHMLPHGCHMLPHGCHRTSLGALGCYMLSIRCRMLSIICRMLSKRCHARSVHLQPVFFLAKMFLFLRAFFREASTELLTHPKCTLGSQLVGGGTYVRTPPCT